MVLEDGMEEVELEGGTGMILEGEGEDGGNGRRY